MVQFTFVKMIEYSSQLGIYRPYSYDIILESTTPFIKKLP